MAKNVLIVDDAATLRNSILRSHQKAGIDAAEAPTNSGGRDGLELTPNGRSDLILGDIDRSNPTPGVSETFVK